MNNLSKMICLLLAMVFSSNAFAQIYSCSADKRTDVFILGTFHFAQTDSIYDVLSNKHQRNIKKLCKIIQDTKPDKVFVERQPEYEYTNKIDSLFGAYVKEDVLPNKNEIYQVGFRVAKEMGHPKVYQCDHPGMYGRYARASRAYAEANDQLEILEARAKGTTERHDFLVNEDSIMMKTSLLDYLRWINSEEVMTTSHARYITTYPQVGSTDFYNYDEDDTLIGAELVADWYRRNIMIYSKIINQIDYTEDAIFLVIGADHVPIIRNLFRDNPHFNVIDACRWLDTNKLSLSKK